MRQLTSLDAQFLALENSRQTGHVGSLAMLDAVDGARRRVRLPRGQATAISTAAPQLPPLRWRLAEVPFGLDYPYWVEEAELDLGYHVREMALASPGSDQQLADQVARIMSRPLDRARPLWELYVIEGHESGRIAVLTKIHHSVIDGLSGAEIMALLLDLTPEGREVPPPVDDDLADPPPSTLQMLGLGMLGLPRYPVRILRSLPKAIPNLNDTAFGVLPGVGTLSRIAGVARRDGQPRPSFVAPKTKFSGRHLAAPAVRVRPDVPGGLQGGQERARRDGQRRRRVRVRGRGAALATRARRPAGLAVGRAGPGLGAHRRAVRDLRQPHPADAGAVPHGGGGPGRAAADDARSALRAQRPA